MLRIEIHLVNPPTGVPPEIRSQNRICGKSVDDLISAFNKVVAGSHIKMWRGSGEIHSELGECWEIENITSINDRPKVKYYRYDNDFSAECVGEIRIHEVRDDDIWEMMYGRTGRAG